MTARLLIWYIILVKQIAKKVVYAYLGHNKPEICVVFRIEEVLFGIMGSSEFELELYASEGQDTIHFNYQPILGLFDKGLLCANN